MSHNPWYDGKHIGLNSKILVLVRAFVFLLKSVIALVSMALKFSVSVMLSEKRQDEREVREISHFDQPGFDPYYDGVYVDWQGTEYTRGLGGKWVDANGNEYDN